MTETQIIGNPTQKQETHARSFLANEIQQGKQPLPGETEKTSEEIKFIRRVKKILKAEAHQLGVALPNLEESQIHLLPMSTHRANFGPNAPDAVTDPMNCSANINQDAFDTKFEYYFAIAHELVHLQSYVSFQYYPGQWPIATYRSGYTATDFRKNPYTEHFRGLDEAITDAITFEMYERHWPELSKEFKFSRKDQILLEKQKTANESGYGEYLTFIKTIIYATADATNQDRNQLWRKTKKGLFTGDILPLKDIEKTFGPGALRILASLGNWNTQGPEKPDPQPYLDWFMTNDVTEKDTHAKALLSPSEYRKYVVLQQSTRH